jgi:hypothetical protein
LELWFLTEGKIEATVDIPVSSQSRDVGGGGGRNPDFMRGKHPGLQRQQTRASHCGNEKWHDFFVAQNLNKKTQTLNDRFFAGC